MPPKCTWLTIRKVQNSQRGVELSEEEPVIGNVFLDNGSKVMIYFDGFKENALPLANGDNSEQCEGVIFPATCDESDWVLFIECKYADDLKQATDIKNGYPQKMIDQIIATVNYFRKTRY